MAVLVDYYRCSEAVEIFSDTWITTVRESAPVPSEYSRDLMLWMCIAWVFKLPTEFEQTTKTAFITCRSPAIENMNLPIPKPVLDGMDLKRYQSIEELLAVLHNWLDEFRGDTYQCREGTETNFVCSSILLGSLTEEMDRIQCWTPRPEVPFEQLSFDELYEKVRAMKPAKWAISTGNSNRNSNRNEYCSKCRRYNTYNVCGCYNNDDVVYHPCGFQETIWRDAAQIERKLGGLDLADFEDRAAN